MYESGNGVEKDDAMAAIWLRKAADLNYRDAFASLGWLYETGRGVFQDFSEALRWYHKAAKMNHAGAMFRIGAMTEAGNGVTKSEAQAVNWYRQAADLGHVEAMVALGLMHQYGRGVKQDENAALRMFIKASDKGNAVGSFYAGHYYERHKEYGNAVKYYSLAARKGDPASMHNLGVAYDKGLGVERNSRLAAEWVFKALKAGADFTIKQMTDNSGAYSEQFRRQMQRLLSEAGVYDGRVDGEFGPGTKSAIRALAKRAKAGG